MRVIACTSRRATFRSIIGRTHRIPVMGEREVFALFLGRDGRSFQTPAFQPLMRPNGRTGCDYDCPGNLPPGLAALPYLLTVRGDREVMVPWVEV
jgi:hypothetical protein